MSDFLNVAETGLHNRVVAVLLFSTGQERSRGVKRSVMKGYAVAAVDTAHEHENVPLHGGDGDMQRRVSTGFLAMSKATQILIRQWRGYAMVKTSVTDHEQVFYSTSRQVFVSNFKPNQRWELDTVGGKHCHQDIEARRYFHL